MLSSIELDAEWLVQWTIPLTPIYSSTRSLISYVLKTQGTVREKTLATAHKSLYCAENNQTADKHSYIFRGSTKVTFSGFIIMLETHNHGQGP